MTFQAWFDDSGAKGDGRFMVVAGLFGEAQLFATLAHEWDKHLHAKHPGELSYFKTYDATHLSGAFAHWGEASRDAKVRQLAQVIDRDDLLVMSVRVELAAFEKVSQRWRGVWAQPGDAVRHHSMEEPYLLLYQGVFSMAVTEAVRRGATLPIEIVYDDQDILRPSIIASYPEWREREKESPARHAVMPLLPGFRDDKDWVALQMADMVAGNMRMGALDRHERPAFSERLFTKLQMSGMCTDLDEAAMEEIHRHLMESRAREERDAR